MRHQAGRSVRAPGSRATTSSVSCAKVRGYTEKDLVAGVTLAGAPAMLEVVKQGAATLSF